MSFWKKVFGGGEGKIETYADFWQWFERHEGEFYRIVQTGGNIGGNFLGKVLPRLSDIRDGFHALVGLPDDEVAELIFSANGDLKNMVFVDELVAAAPDLPRWQFTALRPKLDLDAKGIRMGDYAFTTENVHFYATTDTDYPDEVAIVLVHDDLTEENRDFLTNGTFIFLDHLLGEWAFATLIDHVEVKSPTEATEELVPIEKIEAYLHWRQKEFVEKYEGTRHDTTDDQHAVIEATQENGQSLFIVANTDLQNWNTKASHPWMLVIELTYTGDSDTGLPDAPESDRLEALEDQLLQTLPDTEGYLYLGRETGSNTRRLYLAGREFKNASRKVNALLREQTTEDEAEYDIYKDKYWRSFAYGRVTGNKS